MGLMDTIFGNSDGVSGKVKKAGWDLYGQYGNAANWYNPQVDTAQQMEAFDQSRLAGQAAGYGRLLGGGYRPSGGVDYMSLARARYAGQAMAKARQQALDWRWRALQAQAGLLPTLGQLNYRQPSGGLLGGIASLWGLGG